MSNGLLILLIVFTVTVMPLAVIMHYVTKWKSTKGLSDEEQQLLEDLWRSSERMESRLNALETILDEQDRKWRKKL
ncbi:envelope stress response membrane protein PspB [Candidatus Rariloculus sp.]|uniref:envelope stress response membrane protein PspB n=1 Tax=Candidatus Rariloculus sp. TaxID=3101265 RepID=UPI003D09F9DD